MGKDWWVNRLEVSSLGLLYYEGRDFGPWYFCKDHICIIREHRIVGKVVATTKLA